MRKVVEHSPAAVPLEVLRKHVEVIEGVMNTPSKEFIRLDLSVKHYFSPGVYVRELFIPKGVLLTGKIHKYPQLNILSMGRIAVLTEEGMRDLTAPFTIVSPAGTKRIAFAHTDCVWTTILATPETDPEKIEDLFTASSSEDYERFLENGGGRLLLPPSN